MGLRASMQGIIDIIKIKNANKMYRLAYKCIKVDYEMNCKKQREVKLAKMQGRETNDAK